MKDVVFAKNLKSDVELDTVLTPELKEEGQVREILRGIQDQRKKEGCKPQDRVKVWYEGSVRIQSLIVKQGSLLKKAAGIETLVTGESPVAGNVKEIDLDGEILKFSIIL